MLVNDSPLRSSQPSGSEGTASQSAHQIVAQVAARRAVRFIHEHNDALTGIDVRRDVIELVNHRDDKAAIVGAENVLKIPLAVGNLRALDAVSVDVL